LKNSELEITNANAESLESKNFNLESDNSRVTSMLLSNKKLKLTIEKLSSNETENTNISSDLKSKHASELEKLLENHHQEKQEWNEIREGSHDQVWIPESEKQKRTSGKSL
jgi:hypothetical protein